MRSIETIFLSISLLVAFASMNPPRAEDTFAPAENPGPLRQARGAAPQPVKIAGDFRVNAFGKPCLIYLASSRAYLIDKGIFDYVVGVSNRCPGAIKIRICQKDGSRCSSVTVPAYRSTEVVMGFGSFTTLFDFVARETP